MLERMGSPSAPQTQELSPAWNRVFWLLPITLLGLGLAVGFGTQGFIDGSAQAYVTLAVLGAVSAAWVGWWTFGPPHRSPEPRGLELYFWVRTALGFALTWHNPFLAFFAFVGYVDAFDILPRRRAFLGCGVVVVTMAGSQLGGLPPDGVAEWVILAVLILINGGIVASLSHFHVSLMATNDARGEQVAELARLNGELTEAIARNDALAAQVTAAAREAGVRAERQRLAREIHDTVAQGLAGILTQLRAAQGDPGAGAEHVAAAERLAAETLAEARPSVQALAPVGLEDRSLAEAIDSLVNSWSAGRATQATFAVLGTAGGLHPEIEATLVRITQESLTNVARHADARRVGVTLTYAETDVLLDVRDDGRGFDLDAPRPTTSFGLRGMRQRVERVAGRLDIESERGAGTAVSARLPAVWSSEAAVWSSEALERPRPPEPRIGAR